jgi:hypothetical protein
MAGSIPITNTVTQGELPIATELQLTDTLLLYRDSSLTDKDLRTTLQMLVDYIRNGMAPLNSPEFTGDATAPTRDAGDNSTFIATTAFVNAVRAQLVELLNAKVAIQSIVDTLDSTDAEVPLSANAGRVLAEALGEKANLDSPEFTGVPRSTTPDTEDNSTQIATTEFVKAVAAIIMNAITTVETNTQQFGQILKWRANTQFYASRTVNDVVTAPDIVYEDGSFWVVTQDFTSGVDFSEKDGPNVVLVRLKMDTDVDHLELTASATLPLFVNQELASYLAVRNFVIPRTHTLPNSRLQVPTVVHRAICNADIVDPTVITLYKTKAATGVTTAIGTISFNTTSTPSGMPGSLVFNDAEAPAPAEALVFSPGDVFTMKLTTKSSNLQWLRVNMLGDYIPFTSPYLDTQTPPAPFIPMAILNMDGTNGSTVYTDSTGRHSPIGYGGSLSTAQFVDGTASFYANQDGRIFLDGYNVDSADFDFTGKDFSIVCYIKPISITNDYVWCKTSGGNLGLNLKLGMSGPDPIVYLWPMTNGIGATVPDLLSRPGFTKVEVRREGTTWSLLIDDILAQTGTDDCTISGWESGSGYRGFLIAGAANDNRYSGYIDKFSISVK